MIDASGSVPDDPLENVRTKLMKLYIDSNASSNYIGTEVKQVKLDYKATLGHLAEFWLLLSVGEVLAHPRLAYGINAGAYRQMARSCNDASTEMIASHGEMASELLLAREGPSDIRASTAAMYVKQEYTLLADSLVDAP